MKKIYEATSEDAIEKLLKLLNNEITLLSFFSPTCGPCMMLEPILDELVEENLFNIIRVNVLDYPDLADKFNITSWPTNFIYKDNSIINKIVGYQPKEEWVRLVKN